MKTRPLPITCIALAAVLATSPALRAQQSDAVNKSNAAYKSAIAHETVGDAAAAKAAYEQALKLNPRNASARYRLGQLKINYDKVISKGQERKIGQVMIPEFKVDNADFSDALRALAINIEKQSKEEVAPNFIIQDPSNSIATQKVTLKMKNIPSGEVLNYMLQMAKAKARYDKHAVVITPR